jgi:hypothetical protein
MKTIVAFVTIVAFGLSSSLAFADVNSSYIKIETSNSGSISNYTSAQSATGGNWAGGSRGGRGGSAGDVEVAGPGNFNNGGALAGDGGDGGSAGVGGTVTSGDADAAASSENFLNMTDVDVDLLGSDVNSSKIKIETDNSECGCQESGNMIDSRTKARARTGGNDADGSSGGKGGYGGDVSSALGDNNNGGAEAGSGGMGGDGADGGWVETGAATSSSGSVNVLNETLVRVRV